MAPAGPVRVAFVTTNAGLLVVTGAPFAGDFGTGAWITTGS